MPKSDDDRLTYWYYRVGERELGPVLTNRLRQLARKGELAAEDFVRRGKMGEWVAAGSIEDLQARPRRHPAAGPVPPATARSDSAEEVAGGVADFGASSWTILKFWWYDALASVGERSWLIRRVGVAVVLMATLAVGGRLAWNVDLSDWKSPPDPFVTYRALWDELKQKRSASTEEADWDELSHRARGELAPIVARLETLAGARNRSAQLLLWAGRDCLPQMLADARTEPSAAERRFEEYLTSAEKIQQGEAIKGYKPGLDDGLARSTWRWITGDPLSAAMWGVMVPIDVAIVLWLGRMWRRRERSSHG